MTKKIEFQIEAKLFLDANVSNEYRSDLGL